MEKYNPDNTVKQYFYNDKNNVIKEIDELGNVTEYIYDTDGVTLLKEVKLLNETSYSEEADQNLFVITSYTYYNPSEVSNIKGLIKTINGKDGLITYTYDNYGNIKTKIDGNNIETVYTSNKLGWVLTEQTNNQYLIEYEYDNNKNILSIKKDNKILEKTEYNYQNKPIKVGDGSCNKEEVILPNQKEQYIFYEYIKK